MRLAVHCAWPMHRVDPRSFGAIVAAEQLDDIRAEEAADVLARAERAGLDDLAIAAGVWAIMPGVADDQLAPALPGQIDQIPRLPGVERHWLLHQHMQIARQTVPGDLVVRGMR